MTTSQDYWESEIHSTVPCTRWPVSECQLFSLSSSPCAFDKNQEEDKSKAFYFKVPVSQWRLYSPIRFDIKYEYEYYTYESNQCFFKWKKKIFTEMRRKTILQGYFFCSLYVTTKTLSFLIHIHSLELNSAKRKQKEPGNGSARTTIQIHYFLLK